MELRDLRYFVHISELGSFTRAAAALGIAQPSLTRHMQKLEEHLGVPVFTALMCLERAQAAIRVVHGSGITGQFGEIVAAYTDAIRAAVASD